MADADVGEPAIGRRPPQRVGDTEVGVADHAEHGVEAPLAQHVHHLVHKRDRLVDDRDLDLERPVAGGAHGIGHGLVAEPRRWGAGARVVLVGVPRTDEVPALELPVAEGTTLVRAPVVERRPCAVLAVHEADGTAAGHDGGDPPGRNAGAGHADPDPLVTHPNPGLARQCAGRGRRRA